MAELTAEGETSATITATLTELPELTASGETSATITATLTELPELTASGETSATLTPTYTDQSLTGSGETDATLTATTDLTPDVFLKGGITAAAADSIAVLPKGKPRLPIADIIDAIRILSDEIAHAISSHALAIATVYSETVIALYICERIRRDMPAGRLVCGLLDHLTGG